MIEKLKSIYYVLTKPYRLFWREEPFPKTKKIGFLILYEDCFLGPVEWGESLPPEIIEYLKETIENWEKRNAENKKGGI